MVSSVVDLNRKWTANVLAIRSTVGMQLADLQDQRTLSMPLTSQVVLQTDQITASGQIPFQPIEERGKPQI